MGDCSSIQNVAAPPLTLIPPWRTAPTNYVNPKGYQILSAGKNGFWGTGDYSGGSADDPLKAGNDDQANFSSRILGANQQ
jgi:hypothetical protein